MRLSVEAQAASLGVIMCFNGKAKTANSLAQMLLSEAAIGVCVDLSAELTVEGKK